MRNNFFWPSTVSITIVIVGVCLYYFGSKPIVLATGGPDDICGTRAFIAADGTGLHQRPSSYSAMRKKLEQNQNVNICLSEGKWSAVIVAEEEKDCGIPHDAAAGNYEYSGPCAYGWIPSKLLQMLAG